MTGLKTHPVEDFGKDESGANSVEFAIIALLFAIIIFATIDLGRAMWNWSMANKATQIGARHAVVRNVVATGIRTLDATAAPISASVGNTIPVASLPDVVTCQSNDGAVVNCTSDGSIIATGSDQVLFDEVLVEMQKYYPRIQRENLVIEYRHVGLGFVGNPIGRDFDPAVTVKLRDLVFITFTPLVSLVDIPMPDFAATLTSEGIV